KLYKLQSGDALELASYPMVEGQTSTGTNFGQAFVGIRVPISVAGTRQHYALMAGYTDNPFFTDTGYLHIFNVTVSELVPVWSTGNTSIPKGVVQLVLGKQGNGVTDAYMHLGEYLARIVIK